MKNSEIMKTKFNKFWKGIAVAAVLSAGGAGYVTAKSQMAPTHYNTADAGDPPIWTPIPAGQEVKNCADDNQRLCTSVEVSPGNFVPTAQRGYATLGPL